MWKELASNLIALVVGYLLNFLWMFYRRKRRSAGQSAIFAGLDGSTKFVFPPREEVASAFLPRISIEDFMAINNIISAYILAGFDPPNKVLDSKHVDDKDKRQNNLILICSSKTNATTAEAIRRLKESNPAKAHLIPDFINDLKTDRIQIRWKTGIFPSETFDQEGPLYTDIAIILKSRNPWAGQHKIMIVAGIRGIGTWGAAEFLKKWWKPLYEKKGEKKTGDFAALVKIEYENFDIKSAELLDLIDFNN
jgi:hypothetical protein